MRRMYHCNAQGNRVELVDLAAQNEAVTAAGVIMAESRAKGSEVYYP